MKNSGVDWIGEIPAKWDVVPFRSYAEMRREKNKGVKTRELLALSFALGVTLYRDKVFNMDRVKDDYEDYQLVYENDLVLSPNDIIKGSVYVSKYYGCISPMYLVFSARDAETYHLRYLSYLLRTQEAGRKFFFIARGLIGDILDNGKYVTRRMSVSKQDLMSFKVLLPSVSEQRKIVSFLNRKCSEIDEMIALQEKVIDELKTYKQSVITEAVTKGLNPDVPMKDSGIEWIGETPEHWKVKPIKWDFDIIAGATPKTDKSELWDGAIPWITPADYKTEDRYIKQGRRCITEEGMASCATTLLPKGSVIFSKRAPIGLVVVNSQPLCTNQGCLGCIPRSANSSYFYYAMSAFTEQYELYGSGTTFKEISATNFADFRLPCPSIEEQESIALCLDKRCTEIDNLISIKLSKIDSLKEYKKSIIYEYVTGKKEVI